MKFLTRRCSFWGLVPLDTSSANLFRGPVSAQNVFLYPVAAGSLFSWHAFIYGDAAHQKGFDVVNAVSISLAMFVLVVRLIWRKKLKLDPVFDISRAIADFLTAASLVPFLLMVGAAFNDRFFQQLLESARGAIPAAGFVGILFLLRELLKKPH